MLHSLRLYIYCKHSSPTNCSCIYINSRALTDWERPREKLRTQFTVDVSVTMYYIFLYQMHNATKQKKKNGTKIEKRNWGFVCAACLYQCSITLYAILWTSDPITMCVDRMCVFMSLSNCLCVCVCVYVIANIVRGSSLQWKWCRTRQRKLFVKVKNCIQYFSLRVYVCASADERAPLYASVFPLLLL